jgi:hypothetical protein
MNESVNQEGEKGPKVLEVKLKLEEKTFYDVNTLIDQISHIILRKVVSNIGNAQADDEIAFFTDEVEALKALADQFDQIDDVDGETNWGFCEDNTFFKDCVATTDHYNDHYQCINVLNLTPSFKKKIEDLIESRAKSIEEAEEKQKKEEEEKEEESKAKEKACVVGRPFILSGCCST